jgi:hypothetical protein
MILIMPDEEFQKLSEEEKNAPERKVDPGHRAVFQLSTLMTGTGPY